jgi:antibiotic biosynthesis monooxygenase (ABM) superfamily enzyme
MSNQTTFPRTHKLPPPNKHQLALMIWLAVFPTLTIINLVFADWLGMLPPVLRTFVLATVTVPIVIYGIMPHLHRLRSRVLTRAAHGNKSSVPTDKGGTHFDPDRPTHL